MDFQSAMETFAEAWVAANTQTPLTEAAEAQGILLNQASLGGPLPPTPSSATLHELTAAATTTNATDRTRVVECLSSSAGQANENDSDAMGVGRGGRRSPGGTAGAPQPQAGNNSTTGPLGTTDFRNPSNKLLALSSKSIPVHCLVEQGCSQSTEPTVELDSYAIVPSTTLFSDLVRTALIRLGYSSSEVLGARGAIQIKNWRALTFDQITEASEATVGDILGELATIATLRIRLYSRPKVNAASDVKEKLLQVLLAQSQSVLLSSGCPIDQTILAALSKGRLECDITEDTRKKFDQWYLQQVFHHCRQVVLQQQQQHQLQQQAVHQVVQHQQQAQQQQQQSHQVSQQVPVLEVTYSTTSPPRLTTQPSHAQNRTRIRTSFDPELELPKLHHWFAENQHPSRMQIQQYVRELNSLESRRGRKPLDVNNVVYWFKNARAAYKRAEQRYCPEGSNGLRSPYSESAAENLASHQDRFATSGADDERVVDTSSNCYDNMDSGDENMDDLEPVLTLDLSIKRPKPSEQIEDDDKLLIKEEPGVEDSSEQSMDSSVSCDKDDDQVIINDEYSNNSQGPDILPVLSNGHEANSPTSQGNSNSGELVDKTLSVCIPMQVNCLEERRKRNRTFIDPVTEVPRLELWFSTNTHPSHSQIVRFTQELNSMPYRHKFPKLEPKNIQFWFKNRRAKCKRLHLANYHHNGVERLIQTAM